MSLFYTNENEYKCLSIRRYTFDYKVPTMIFMLSGRVTMSQIGLNTMHPNWELKPWARTGKSLICSINPYILTSQRHKLITSSTNLQFPSHFTDPPSNPSFTTQVTIHCSGAGHTVHKWQDPYLESDLLPFLVWKPLPKPLTPPPTHCPCLIPLFRQRSTAYIQDTWSPTDKIPICNLNPFTPSFQNWMTKTSNMWLDGLPWGTLPHPFIQMWISVCLHEWDVNVFMHISMCKCLWS